MYPYIFNSSYYTWLYTRITAIYTAPTYIPDVSADPEWRKHSLDVEKEPAAQEESVCFLSEAETQPHFLPYGTQTK